MNGIQEQLFLMYCDVKDILDAHGIMYFVHYGTAIGALRHDGFIPWDNDIDVVIWHKDLEEVSRVLSEELDQNKYYYHVPSADTHPHVILRSDDFETDLKKKRSLFIDIFIMEDYPDRFLRRVLVSSMIWAEVIALVILDYVRFPRIHACFSWIPRWFERRARGLTNKDTTLCTVYSTTFGDDIFPKSYFESTFQHRFESIDVPLPNCIDVALMSLFSDYMTPPPENKRHGANGVPCNVYKDYLRDKRKAAKNQ